MLLLVAPLVHVLVITQNLQVLQVVRTLMPTMVMAITPQKGVMNMAIVMNMEQAVQAMQKNNRYLQ